MLKTGLVYTSVIFAELEQSYCGEWAGGVELADQIHVKTVKVDLRLSYGWCFDNILRSSTFYSK